MQNFFSLNLLVPREESQFWKFSKPKFFFWMHKKQFWQTCCTQFAQSSKGLMNSCLSDHWRKALQYCYDSCFFLSQYKLRCENPPFSMQKISSLEIWYFPVNSIRLEKNPRCFSGHVDATCDNHSEKFLLKLRKNYSDFFSPISSISDVEMNFENTNISSNFPSKTFRREDIQSSSRILFAHLISPMMRTLSVESLAACILHMWSRSVVK